VPLDRRLRLLGVRVGSLCKASEVDQATPRALPAVDTTGELF
jgi:hypothetical protein